MAAPNNAPDWATAFAEFHARHRDVKGRKLVFTAIFNAAMEAFIACDEVPLVWRVLAWIWRKSWGNDSDHCVDGIGGDSLGQQACADHFDVDKRRVHDCVILLRGLYFILPSTGHKLYPIDDPFQAAQKDPHTTNVESPAHSGLFKQFCDDWKVLCIADFQHLESAEAEVNRLKIVRLRHYKEWLKDRTNHAQPIKANSQQVTAVHHPKNESTPAAANLPNKTAAADPLPEASVAQELNLDDDAARRLVAGCKSVEKEITSQEIVELAQMKLAAAREQIRKGKITSVTGLLIKHVPTMCSGSTLQEARAAIARRGEERASKIAYIRESWHEFEPDEQERALREYPELQEQR